MSQLIFRELDTRKATWDTECHLAHMPGYTNNCDNAVNVFEKQSAVTSPPQFDNAPYMIYSGIRPSYLSHKFSSMAGLIGGQSVSFSKENLCSWFSRMSLVTCVSGMKLGGRYEETWTKIRKTDQAYFVTALVERYEAGNDRRWCPISSP